MNTFAILIINTSGLEKTVHVVAADAAHAMIEFRKEYDLDDWSVRSLTEITNQQVIEHPA